MTKEQKQYLKEGEGFMDITLARPATISGAKTSVLRMREPTVDDQLVLDEMKGTPVQKEINLFANLCEVAPEDIRKLTLRNYRRVQEAWENFTD